MVSSTLVSLLTINGKATGFRSGQMGDSTQGTGKTVSNTDKAIRRLRIQKLRLESGKRVNM